MHHSTAPTSHAELAGAHAAPLHDTPNEGAASSAIGGEPCETKGNSGVSGVRQPERARRGVAETSLDAFHSLPVADYLAPKERAILALFTGPDVRLSRQQISALVPLSINSTCGRVDSLLTGGHLEECGDRVDPNTRKRQKLLQLPRNRQLSLVKEGS